MTFPLAPLYKSKGIRFINEAASRIDLAGHVVTTSAGEELSYDRLFIGTGPRLSFEKVPGLGPHGGYTQSVCNLEHAILAREAWERFVLLRVSVREQLGRQRRWEIVVAPRAAEFARAQSYLTTPSATQ